MPLDRYGILKGKAIDSKPGSTRSNHFQVHIRANGESHRIAINVYSSDTRNRELQFLVLDPFQHPICDRIKDLPEGFTPVPSQPGGMALDFIRGNLFDISRMQILPPSQDGPDNDLNDKIGFYISQAINRQADVYAFGQKWGPEPERPDQYFQFEPGNGIHDIHMNQGNPPGRYEGDNGVWQDGGVLIHFPEENRWIAYFLKFQSQTVHSEDGGGENPGGTPIDTDPGNQPEVTKGVRILAALVNPAPEDVGHEQVLLFNPLAAAISLKGWGLLDSQKKKETLATELASGATLVVRLTGQNARLSNQGGILTLVDEAGLKIHGVSYTKEQARPENEWVVF
ncbi:DUF2278 family protein [Larkinella insperata]|uniref:DUF2278 family protein n=1 Tax=Larkinella insperata TaxID=332158 RepID=A0ABW3Q618_9BACT|nr:DUF2278 family protein [Larkinella insperata]